MEQLVLLLIIAAISFINWLLQKSAEHKQRRAAQQPRQPAQAPQPPHHNDEFLEALGRPSEPPAPRENHPAPTPRQPQPEPDPEEQLRRFFEALGLPIPEESKPAPAPTPTPAPPPLPAEPAPAPQPAATTPRSHPEPSPTPRAKSQPAAPDAWAAPLTAPSTASDPELQRLAHAFELHQHAEERHAAAATASLRALLADPASLRQAILIREILGPPKALQEHPFTLAAQ